MPEKQKIVLILSYYFPPYAGVASFRTKKICKFLPQNGWKPWVLSIDSRYYGTKIIDTGNSDIEKTRLTRIPYYKFPGNILAVKLFFPLIALIFALYHRKILSALYMSGSPFHPFPLTLLLTRLLHIPSILDFRDSWSINHGFDGRKAEGVIAKIRQFICGILEYFSIRYASAVIFCTPVLLNEYTDRFPYYRSKYHMITNGYDPDDFVNIVPRRVSPKTTLILAGKVNIYTPEIVVGLMKSLSDFPDLHFLYIGEENDLITAAARRYKAEKQVTSLPHQLYKKTLTYIAGADYTLLTNGMANGLGTKIFDYLALQKPVICFVPKNSVIKKMFGGHHQLLIFESPHSEHNVKTALQYLEKWQHTDDFDKLLEFSREKTTQHLTEILNNISN